MAIATGEPRATPPRPDFEDFSATRRIRELDGLRGIAILFVIAGHMHDPILAHLQGVGVPLFFVNSGFLITLLLLREQSKRGGVSWRAFYTRRAFRLFPVYFFALGLFSILVYGGLAENAGDWNRRLLYFLTFQNEFVPGATFGHTWTLAVQEKFYIAWPVLAFGVFGFLKTRGKLALASIITTTLTAAWLAFPTNYSLIFIPLMLGCTLALLAFDRRTYRIISNLAHPAAFSLAIAAAIMTKAFDLQVGKLDVPFSFTTALLYPGLIVGSAWVTRRMRSKSMVFVGVRAYSIYLLHPLVLSAVDLVIPPGESDLISQTVRFVAVVAGSVAFASVTYRFIETPAMRMGTRFLERHATPKVGSAA